MPEFISQSADNPEFARIIDVARLGDLQDLAFDISPEPAEAAALARLMGARAVRKLRFRGRLARLPRGGWQLEGDLGATVVQICVITLDPVTTRLDQSVRRTFLPGLAPLGPELAVDAEDEEDVEPLGERIDLGLIAAEALALALPAYPRKPGATLPSKPRHQGDAEPEPVKPFAALAALRDKLDEGS